MEKQKNALRDYLQINLWPMIALCALLTGGLVWILLSEGTLYWVALPMFALWGIILFVIQIAAYIQLPRLLERFAADGSLASVYEDFQTAKYGYGLNGQIRLGEKYVFLKGNAKLGIIRYEDIRQVYIEVHRTWFKIEQFRKLVIKTSIGNPSIQYNKKKTPEDEIEGVLSLLRYKNPSAIIGNAAQQKT